MRSISSFFPKSALGKRRRVGLMLGALATVAAASFAIGGQATAATNGHMIRIQLPDTLGFFWPPELAPLDLDLYVRGNNNEGNKTCKELEKMPNPKPGTLGTYEKPDWWWKGDVEVIAVDHHGDTEVAYRAWVWVHPIELLAYDVQEFLADDINVPWLHRDASHPEKMRFERDTSWVTGTKVCPE